jgi:hypothetical protein
MSHRDTQPADILGRAFQNDLNLKKLKENCIQLNKGVMQPASKQRLGKHTSAQVQ